MRTVESLLIESRDHWDNAKALFPVGRELHDRNRLPAARAVLERVIELDPTGEPDAYAYLSYAWFRDTNPEEGEKALRRGIEATDSDDLRSALASFSSDVEEAAKLREAIAGSEAPTVRAAILARECYGGDDPAAAVEKLEAFAAEHGSNMDVQENLMWVLLTVKGRKLVPDLDLRETGVPLADRRIEANPNEIRGHWMKLQMLIVQEDWEAVLTASGAALESFPDDETMMCHRGRACENLGDDDRAMFWFGRAIGAKPSYTGARVHLAKIHEKNDRLELAEEIFQEIPVANPDHTPGPVSLALFYVRRERWEEAEGVFNEAWPKLPSWFKHSLNDNEDAQQLLLREAMKTLAEGSTSEE